LAKAAAPDWVPERYAKYFHRYVDERPAWERALGFLQIPVSGDSKAFALVAGVSDYPNMSGPHGDLAPARLDVEKMVAYLEREPESFNEIVVLLDEEVTAENLRYFLTQYFPQRLSETEGSRFLFAYSGHGMTAENGRGYLLTSEARNLQDRFNAGISMAELRVQFQEIVDLSNKTKRHQVLALINACYGVEFHRMSAAFGEEDEPLPTGTTRPTREGAHAITAGGAGELTWHDAEFGDGDEPKGSIFFEAVLAALDGRADRLPADGLVSVGELETYLRDRVSRFTEEQQNPAGDDLLPTQSPGGFYFLDRDRHAANDNAEPLEGQWWGGLSFGEAPAQPPSEAAAPIAEDEETVISTREPEAEEDGAMPRVPLSEDQLLGVMAGRWSGEAEEPGGLRFGVELTLTSDCAMNEQCGTIAVPHVPCRGRITLIPSEADGFEFHVDEFDSASDRSICTPGAGEVLKLRADGDLDYTATYSGARGVLRRVE
jgi:hypothetical protein